MEKNRIDPASNVPLVHQVARLVRAKIARAELAVGDYLPSVREFGNELGVNFNTVAKAYRQLETEGLVEIRHGLGARVRERRIATDRLKAKRALLEDLDEVICQLALTGADQEQVVDFFAEALGQHFSEKRA